MIEFPLPFADLLNNNMRSDINGFYCRHTSCTKKFVNSQSRSRHEKNCQYRSSTESEPTKVQHNNFCAKPKIKQLSVDSAQLFYHRVNSSVRQTRYSDIDMEAMSRGGKYAIQELKLQHNLSKSNDEMLWNSKNKNLLRQGKIEREDHIVQPSSANDYNVVQESANEEHDCADEELSGLPDIYISSPTSGCLPSVNDQDETASITSECTVTDDDTTTEYELPNDALEDEGGSMKDEEEEDDIHSHSYRCKLYTPCVKRENELFCISLVDTLDRLESRKQRLAKVKIQQVLYDLEYNCEE